jgi:hypothetical protein
MHSRKTGSLLPMLHQDKEGEEAGKAASVVVQKNRGVTTTFLADKKEFPLYIKLI